MKRTPLHARKLPTYSRGEELMNMITHIVGGALGVVVLLSCVIRSALRDNLFGIISCTIYIGRRSRAFTTDSFTQFLGVHHSVCQYFGMRKVCCLLVNNRAFKNIKFDCHFLTFLSL